MIIKIFLNAPATKIEAERLKLVIPFSISDIWIRLEVLSGLKMCGHTDILTETSNLIDEFYKITELHTEQQYRNTLDKFFTIKKISYQVDVYNK